MDDLGDCFLPTSDHLGNRQFADVDRLFLSSPNGSHKIGRTPDR